MFGWRARIGYLCPSVLEMITYDFYRIAPAGVGLIGVTCMIEGWSREAYRKGLEQVERCAEELGRRKCDFIIHAGVPLVVSQGTGFEKEIIKRVERAARTPATTSIAAAIASLQALGAYRIALVNPYPPELNESVVKFLSGYGFEVRSVVSLGTDFTRIGQVTGDDVYQAAKRAVKEAGRLDALYLPCPQFPVLDVAQEIEEDFGVPAVAHLASELWAAFKTIGVRAPVRGFGMLLASL